MCDCEKPTNIDEILERARAKGIEDPEVVCRTHNFKTTYSKLSDVARMALHAGLDTLEDDECILKR